MINYHKSRYKISKIKERIHQTQQQANQSFLVTYSTTSKVVKITKQSKIKNLIRYKIYNNKGNKILEKK